MVTRVGFCVVFLGGGGVNLATTGKGRKQGRPLDPDLTPAEREAVTFGNGAVDMNGKFLCVGAKEEKAAHVKNHCRLAGKPSNRASGSQLDDCIKDCKMKHGSRRQSPTGTP
jgi:hypothetical protein